MDDDLSFLREEPAEAYRVPWDLHVHPTGHRSWRDPSEHRSEAVKLRRARVEVTEVWRKCTCCERVVPANQIDTLYAVCSKCAFEESVGAFPCDHGASQRPSDPNE